MTEQRLSPKSIAVLRQLLAAQPESPNHMDDPAPCGDCPEREELALIYKILPELRDHIQPLIALKRKLED